MATLLVMCIAASTLAFGAVYPWGYGPLFAVAATLGLAGIVRARGLGTGSRAVGAALTIVLVAIGLQLIPLTERVLAALSPMAARVLEHYSLGFAAGMPKHPLSINPGLTLLASVALVTLALYLVGVSGLLSGLVLRRLPGQLIVFGVLLALFSVMQRERANGLVYWFWKPQEGGGANAFGPFVNRNHFAGWMLMSISLALGYWLGQLERSFRHVKPSWHARAVWCASPEANTILRTGAGITVMAISLVWTLSRSGILSFLVVVACFSWLAATRAALSPWRRRLGVALIGGLVVAAAVLRGPDRIVAWFGDTTDAESRLAAWQDGWRVVRDFPGVGTGLNTYGTAMLFYQQSSPKVHLGSAHNDYLQLLAEGGLLVTVPAVLAIGVFCWAVRRNLKAARHESRGYWIRAGAGVGLLAIGVQEAVEFSLQIPANAFLFCTLAAIALAPVHRPVPYEGPGRHEVTPGRPDQIS